MCDSTQYKAICLRICQPEHPDVHKLMSIMMSLIKRTVLQGEASSPVPELCSVCSAIS